MAIEEVTVTIPDRGQEAGVPRQARAEYPDSSNALFTGSTPKALTTDELIPNPFVAPSLQVCFIDPATGVVAKATFATKANAILITGINAAAAGAKAPFYRGGCFNPALLVWDASFDTAEKKRRAFEGAASPTQIVIRPVQAYSEVSPFPA